MTKFLASLLATTLILSSNSYAVDDDLLIKSDLKYVGAFRVSYSSSDDGRIGFSEGRFAVSPATNTFFFTGNPNKTLAEYSIPTLVNSLDIGDLNFTGAPIQEFTSWSSLVTYTTDNNDIRNVGAMHIIDGKLYMSVYDAYDAASAAGFDVDTMITINDPYNLDTTTATGYYAVDDNLFAAGWLSAIPAEHQTLLGGDYLTGSARMASINGRWSMGPSAYSFDLVDLQGIAAGGTLANTKLQKYPLYNRMDWQLPNSNSFNYDGGDGCPSFVNDNSLWDPDCVKDNDIWTEVSRAFYGAIIPDTDTYLTVGRVGGRRHGQAYKNYPINSGGRSCSGECPYDWNDWDNYIWLFDVQDLADHKNGLTEEYDAMPYAYGPVVHPFQDMNEDGFIVHMTAADYDATNNRLYIVLGQADNLASFESTPIIVVYEIVKDRPSPPSSVAASLSLTWVAPTDRVDGTAIAGADIDGYEINANCGNIEFSFQTTDLFYTLDSKYAACENSVAAFDTDGVYSEFVWNGVTPTDRITRPVGGGVRDE